MHTRFLSQSCFVGKLMVTEELKDFPGSSVASVFQGKGSVTLITHNKIQVTNCLLAELYLYIEVLTSGISECDCIWRLSL